MKRRCLLSTMFGCAIPFLMNAGCTGTGYYTEEDEAAMSVTVAPVTEEPAEETAPASGAATPAAGATRPALSARDLVKAMRANPLAGPDGLERHRDWGPLEWDNPCTASVWKRSESADDVVLVVALEGGASDKVAVSRKVNLAFEESGTLRMDVYNAVSRTIPVAFAVFSSVDRVYSEAKAQPAAPGWNHLEFDLGASTYKTASSEWKHTAKLWGLEDVRELVLLFYEGGVAQLAVDRLEVDSQAPAESAPEAPPPEGAADEPAEPRPPEDVVVPAGPPVD